MPETIEIDGFDQLRAALIVMPEKARPILEKAVTLACDAVIGQLKEYPPATDANRPGRKDKRGKPKGYYERGRGWWRPVMRRATIQTAGRIAGMGRGYAQYGKGVGVIKARGSDVAGYKLASRSQLLGRHWARKFHPVSVSSTNDGVEGVIGTTVTYAKYVHLYQSPLFAMRGWKSINQAFALAQDDIRAAFEDAANDVIKLLDGRNK